MYYDNIIEHYSLHFTFMHSENVALAISVATVNHSILYDTKIISIEVLVILRMNALAVD